MNVETITMDPELAREHLKSYRTALHRSADEEYQAAATAYEALAMGQGLVYLSRVIQQAGLHECGRPRLAIGRADRRQVSFTWRRHENAATFDTSKVGRWNARQNAPGLVVDVDMGENFTGQTWERRGYSLVPMVPPQVLAKVGRSFLRHHYILWEVEEWADSPIMAMPDRDPLLLRRLAGDAYVIVAAWDLTEVERLVMTGRREA